MDLNKILEDRRFLRRQGKWYYNDDPEDFHNKLLDDVESYMNQELENRGLLIELAGILAEKVAEDKRAGVLIRTTIRGDEFSQDIIVGFDLISALTRRQWEDFYRKSRFAIKINDPQILKTFLSPRQDGTGDYIESALSSRIFSTADAFWQDLARYVNLPLLDAEPTRSYHGDRRYIMPFYAVPNYKRP